MADSGKLKNWLNNIATGLAVIILYNLILTAVLGYAGYYVLNRFDELSQTNNALNESNQALFKELRDFKKGKSETKVKREVFSSLSWMNKSQSSPNSARPNSQKLVTVDFRPLIELMINSTVEKALLKERALLPTFSGSTYLHWGGHECPSTSTKVYHGLMAGSVSGGGVNYQCIPPTPQYQNTSNSASRSELTKVLYRSNPLTYHEIPCAACEANRRLTHIMIPARVDCPAHWTVEYVGQLLGSASLKDSAAQPLTYECVDVSKEGLSVTKFAKSSAIIEGVLMKCDDSGVCPPPNHNQLLACVVCSK